MVKQINRLTARGAELLMKPGRYADGGNLYLSIQQSGARRWVFLYRFDKRQREMMLGSAGKAGISLADARVRAASARDLLNAGKDPLEARAEDQRQQRKVPTFAEYVKEYLGRKDGSWRNPKSAQQWAMTLTHYCKGSVASPWPKSPPVTF